MAQPIITIMDDKATQDVTSWSIGEINANSESPVKAISIWNNKGGVTDVSDLKDATIACLDKDGGSVGKMSTEKWMKVRVNTTADLDGTSQKIFSAIGGATTRPLRAEGVLAAAGNVIKGTVNDGTLANAKNNYSLAELKLVVPSNATEGLQEFIVRAQGYYT